MTDHRPTTLGDLRKSGYAQRSVKDEMRHNLVAKLKAGDDLFPGVQGYDDTVVRPATAMSPHLTFSARSR